MRCATLLLLAALLVIPTACNTAEARPPGGPRDGPALRLVLAAGDTARGWFTWTAGPRAASAVVTVRATSYPATSAWVGLPTDLARPPGGTHNFMAVSPTADSADLTACARWVNAAGATPELCSTSQRWRRPPGQGTVGWDSLKVSVRPDSAAILLGAQRVLCGFREYPSGHILTRTADRPACDSIAARFFTAAQRAGTAAEQAREDAACYTWASSRPTAVGVLAAPCAAAATVNGLQLTWRQDALPAFRYVAATPGPVAVIDQQGRLRCLRPGTVTVTAAAEGVVEHVPFTCTGSALQVALR